MHFQLGKVKQPNYILYLQERIYESGCNQRYAREMRVESRIRYQGYSSMPEYPKGVSSDEEKNMQESETKALFSVIGMTCSACAGSVEKAIKRLPGIKEVAVDVLKDRTQVIFSPSSVNEETIRQTIEDIGFKATLIEETANEKCIWVCRIRIVGMACTSCSGAVESVLKLVPGVQRAQVALATGEAEVKCDHKLLSCKELLQAIDDIGFEAIIVGTGESRNKIQLKVDGLCNENNVQMIVSSLEGQPGIQDIQVEAELHKVSISYLADVTGPRNFIRVIESTGSGQFKATIFPERGGRGTHKQEEIIQHYNSLLWSLVFSIPVFLTSMIFMYIPVLKDGLDMKIVNMLSIGEVLRWALSTPVQFIIGRRFYAGSYKALRNGSPNMDVLVALGTNAAYFYSVYSVLRAASSPNFKSTDFFETSSMLISFILLGKYLEVLAKGKTCQAITKLMDLAPETAILLTLDDEGNVTKEEEIESQLIQKNDVIKIIPGAKVACDGFVIRGESNVNESMITGEPRPVIKRKGDAVIGGTFNENGVLHIRATKVGSESALSQIVRLVESAQMAKAPVQKFADRISKFFVPLVECIVFDKTGTLTIGKPMVVETRLLKSMALREFYEMVAAVEVNSEHPLAKAIVEYAKKFREEEESNVWPEVKQFESITGQGVMAVVRNREVIVGNKRLMLKKNVAIPVSAENFLEETEGFAQTGILVSIDHELVGVVAISDPVKPAAQEVISILTSMQIKSILVTGDNWGTAHAVAKEVGIGTVIAEAKPEVKAEKVKDLQALNFVVAMVGDGINDSPALVAADIGMAIGAGTDIAIEAADIVLMKSNLEDVITAIDLSRYTFRRICLNYIWALAYNLIAIPVAAGALFPSTGICLPPWVAGAAMAASSLTVVCCSLLLKNYRRPKKLDALELQGLTVE
ncbi:probable copper-transporting ATPase HMA5 isoform X6 [Coffea arabica]|uniref:Probable copper-transporting ATPase HMA5 isoform X6 n=1 Tax=Coffea arabica TaxID=13443 RepID=A0ABM4VJS5_COFAR